MELGKNLNWALWEEITQLPMSSQKNSLIKSVGNLLKVSLERKILENILENTWSAPGAEIYSTVINCVEGVPSAAIAIRRLHHNIFNF